VWLLFLVSAWLLGKLDEPIQWLLDSPLLFCL
jgi:hypothetical protein